MEGLLADDNPGERPEFPEKESVRGLMFGADAAGALWQNA
jgi:hypothetical protein